MSADHPEKQSCAAFAVIESLRLKFTSGNSVPVDRAMITRAEFDAIAALQQPSAQESDLVRCPKCTAPCVG